MSITTDFRPKTWGEVVGQDAIVESLINSFEKKNLAHAYLFVGIRGTGKTTTARLLAKSLNCSNLQVHDPCNLCPSCVAVNNGNSFDIKELDMATNRGIDDVRAIQEIVQYVPAGGRYRVMIMDEAHQMTPQAASALLKILEEPPRNVIFILCTTELQKMLPTIRSRCQVHSFKRIPQEEIVTRLTNLATESLSKDTTISQDVLKKLAVLSEGSMRDAESKLSNLIGLGEVSEETFSRVFAEAGGTAFDNLFKMVRNGDKANIIRYFTVIEEEITDGPGWILSFSQYIFSLMEKDEKNTEIYVKYLVLLEEYMRSIYNNMPVIFVKLLLLKMASLEVVPTSAETVDAYSLARWFNAEKLEFKEERATLEVDGVVVEILKSGMPSQNYPFILEKDISAILALSNQIEKNELVERNLLTLPEGFV